MGLSSCDIPVWENIELKDCENLSLNLRDRFLFSLNKNTFYVRERQRERERERERERGEEREFYVFGVIHFLVGFFSRTVEEDALLMKEPAWMTGSAVLPSNTDPPIWVIFFLFLISRWFSQFLYFSVNTLPLCLASYKGVCYSSYIIYFFLGKLLNNVPVCEAPRFSWW